MKNPGQSKVSASADTSVMQRDSNKMPQNHRPGSTFGTPNKPQNVSAQPMPQNQGYGRVHSSAKMGNKWSGKGGSGC
jgi:hypothetical protein